MRFINLTLRIFGFLIALAVALPVLLIAVLQVPSGRAMISGMVSSLVSTPDRQIALDGLYVGFGLNAAVSRVEIADRTGVWLTAEDIEAVWRPARLMSGDIDVTSISAGQIDLQRAPAPQPDADTASQQDAGDTDSWPLPFDVRVQQLTLEEINLGEALLGAPISLTASGSGSFALDPALISADLDVGRIDGVEAGLSAKAQFQPAAEELMFDIDISEPRGGLAARLLEVPDLPALELTLKGDGPLTDWAAELSLALDGRTTVTGSAQIRETASGRHLTFDLDGDLATLAPPAAQAFVLGTTNASGSARFSHDFEPNSADVSLRTRTVSLDARADLADNAANVSADLSVSAGDGALIGLDI
ncbi:MAG: hypothetical protein ABJG32_20285, partial [Roseibium sp.]